MTQEKMGKVITACVSAGTVLLVCLLSFLIYQWITIATLNKKIAKAEAEVAYWEQQCKENEGTVDYYESQVYLQIALDQLGLLKGNK